MSTYWHYFEYRRRWAVLPVWRASVSSSIALDYNVTLCTACAKTKLEEASKKFLEKYTSHANFGQLVQTDDAIYRLRSVCHCFTYPQLPPPQTELHNKVIPRMAMTTCVPGSDVAKISDGHIGHVSSLFLRELTLIRRKQSVWLLNAIGGSSSVYPPKAIQRRRRNLLQLEPLWFECCCLPLF